MGPVYRDFRPGDVRHSLADISKAGNLPIYELEYSVRTGFDKAAQQYINRFSQREHLKYVHALHRAAQSVIGSIPRLS